MKNQIMYLNKYTFKYIITTFSTFANDFVNLNHITFAYVDSLDSIYMQSRDIYLHCVVFF